MNTNKYGMFKCDPSLIQQIALTAKSKLIKYSELICTYGTRPIVKLVEMAPHANYTTVRHIHTHMWHMRIREVE